MEPAQSPDFLLSRLLYRDALMLVVDKPAGIPVHKGAGGGENLEQYFEPLRFGLPRLPALAHRLDRDTSGCLVLGRHRQALARLGRLFETGRVQKTYWAVVHGELAEAQGRIDKPLAKRSPGKSRWHMKVEEGGQPATTDFRVLASGGGLSWLELKPLTGRTHQLRVHCAAIGHPILADRIYGEAQPGGMLQLHARAVEIPLYNNKPPILAIAPAPPHMQEYIKQWKVPEAAARE